MKEDILKEAIADAEKIRTVAFQNAKLALEEAFQPRLQQMISAKIKEEIGDEDETNDEEIETSSTEIESQEDNEDGEDNEESVEIPIGDDDETTDNVSVSTDPETGDTNVDIQGEPDEEINLTIDGEEIEIKSDEDEDGEMNIDIEDDDEEIDVDNIDSEPVDEDIDINIDLEDDLSDEDGSSDEDDIDIDLEDDETDDELQEENTSYEIEEDEDEPVEEVKKIENELTETKIQLNKAYEVVGILREKLNEINLLNSKLLYSNKIFRSYALNNDAKTKIIESIDRAKNVREAKLIYQTLTETIATKSEKRAQKPFVKAIVENIASTKIAPTKPSKKIINENVDPYEAIRKRNQKLAGIID